MPEGDLHWLPAPSRTVAQYAYDAERAHLHIQFRNGDVGYYTHVPPPLFETFERADSKGTFIRQCLKTSSSIPWVKVSYAPRRGSRDTRSARHANG